MTFEEVCAKVKTLCEGEGFAFHREYENAAVPPKSPFPCFFGKTCETDEESVVSYDGKLRLTQRKTEYFLELWGSGEELSQKSCTLCGQLAAEGFEDCASSGISLSKISRQPSVTIKFSCHESRSEPYFPISGEILVECFGMTFSANEFVIEKGCYIPKEVLASGLVYRGAPCHRDIAAVIRGKIPISSAKPLRERVSALLGNASPLVRDGESFGKLIAESISVSFSKGFSAAYEIKGIITGLD